MPRRRIFGRCHLCLEEKKLSFEHVPPHSAFNDSSVVKKTLDSILERGRHIGTQSQKGSWEYTLCVKCNNDTGAWYGKEYAKWARSGLELLCRVPDAGQVIQVSIPQVHPLRFLKQVVTMFFSVNDHSFSQAHDDLRRFVLNKHNREFPPEIGLYIHLVRGTAGRFSSVLGKTNVNDGSRKIFSEIAFTPFAFQLVLQSHGERLIGDIGRFSKYSYDDKRDVELLLYTGALESFLPGDYRTKEQIIEKAESDLGRPLIEDDDHCLIEPVDVSDSVPHNE